MALEGVYLWLTWGEEERKKEKKKEKTCQFL
jgi:hypothetical protein